VLLFLLRQRQEELRHLLPLAETLCQRAINAFGPQLQVDAALNQGGNLQVRRLEEAAGAHQIQKGHLLARKQRTEENAPAETTDRDHRMGHDVPTVDRSRHGASSPARNAGSHHD